MPCLAATQVSALLGVDIDAAQGELLGKLEEMKVWLLALIK